MFIQLYLFILLWKKVLWLVFFLWMIFVWLLQWVLLIVSRLFLLVMMFFVLWKEKVDMVLILLSGWFLQKELIVCVVFLMIIMLCWVVRVRIGFMLQVMLVQCMMMMVCVWGVISVGSNEVLIFGFLGLLLVNMSLVLWSVNVLVLDMKVKEGMMILLFLWMFSNRVYIFSVLVQEVVMSVLEKL